MKPGQLISNAVLELMQKEAQQAWNQRDFQKGIDTLELASRLAPTRGMVLLQLGHYHGLRHDYAGAEACFDQAVKLSAKKTATMAYVGELSTHFFDRSLAERYFKLALGQTDASPAMFLRLAELYERRSQMEEARSLLARALRMDPSFGAALLTRARLERIDGQLDQAEETLRGLFSNPKREVRIWAYYELGAVLDRAGRFAEAMAAFVAAKEVLRPDAAGWLPQLQKHRTLLAAQQSELTPGLLRRWSDCVPELRPARRMAFLGGHPRSGTTLLEHVLGSHPEIVSAEETQVFMDDALGPLKVLSPGDPPQLAALDAASSGDLRRVRDGYHRSMEKLLGPDVGKRLLIDKNPGLTSFLPAYLRIFPEMKVLMSLRDPRDVVLSCFMQPYVPIELGSVAYHTLENTAAGYALIMGGWRSLRSKLQNSWMEVRYEDTVAGLPAVARQVLDFLDAPWDDRVLDFHEHARRKTVRSPSYADVVRPVFKRAVGRWRNYQEYLEPHLHILEPLVKEFGYE